MIFQEVFNSTSAGTFAGTTGYSLARQIRRKSGMPFVLAITYQALLPSFNKAFRNTAAASEIMSGLSDILGYSAFSSDMLVERGNQSGRV